MFVSLLAYFIVMSQELIDVLVNYSMMEQCCYDDIEQSLLTSNESVSLAILD